MIVMMNNHTDYHYNYDCYNNNDNGMLYVTTQLRFNLYNAPQCNITTNYHALTSYSSLLLILRTGIFVFGYPIKILKG